MKHFTNLSGAIVAIVMMLGVSLSTLAHDFEVDGIYYSYIGQSSINVEVTFSGSSYDEVAGEYTGEVVIPDSVTYSGTRYSVKSIESSAFRGCTGLTSVTIGNSVTSIGWYALDGCTGLTSVTIPNSVTSIGNYAFSGCKGLTEVTIPNSVTSIGVSAFSACTGLTEVNITDLSAWCKIDFSSVYSNPLYYVQHLKLNGTEITNLVIPNDITAIKNYAFSGCTGLTSVTIPNSVTSIGESAFSACTGLTSVTIPDSVTSIGNDAFHGCTGLTSVVIPNSVISIAQFAFSGCTGLTSVTIPNSVTYIGNSAFSGCKGLTEVTIPNSVTSIGSSAFSGCTGLTSVTIPNSVTYIGPSAFKRCTGLTSVTIPNSVTSISPFAFQDCTGLTSVTIGNSVTSIGNDAFNGCIGLTSVTIPNSVTYIGSNAFSGCTGLTSVTIPNSVKAIGNRVFQDCTGLISVTIGATTIGEWAFYNCTGLTSITIDDSVSSIKTRAFSGCKAIKSIFYNAKNCTSVESADDQWFSFLVEIKTKFISIGTNVETLPDYAFSKVETDTIISLSKNPPVCGTESLKIYNSATLYVPKGSYADYWSAPVWQDFKNIVEIEQVATAISLPESMELTLNNSEKLEAVITPTNTTITTIYWESSNPEIAKVDQEGNVTAVANGKATITAHAIDGSELSASCVVRIGVQEVESIALSQTTAELRPNAVLNLTCSVLPEIATDKTIKWTTDNTSVAVVRTNKDGSATVLAVAPGIAKIAATTNDGTNLSDTCVVKVLKLAETIALDKISAVINTGETIDLKARVLPDDVDYKIVTWTSSDEALATVKDNGDGTATVLAVNPGVVTITATTADGSNLSASCELTITQLATSITLDKTAISLPEGSCETITATVLPENASDKTVVWSTSDEAIATVTDNYDGTAVVTIVKVGVATITATTTDGSHLSATCEISGISGITNINSDGSDIEARYDVHGRLLSKPSPGINIIKMSDGSTRKEWVK